MPLPLGQRGQAVDGRMSVAILAMKNLSWNTRIIRQAKALCESGHDVVVVCLVAPDESLRDQAPGVEYIELHVRPVPERLRNFEQAVRKAGGTLGDLLVLVFVRIPFAILRIPFLVLGKLWQFGAMQAPRFRRRGERIVQTLKLARIRASVRADMALRRGANRFKSDGRKLRLSIRRELAHVAKRMGRAFRRARISLRVWARVALSALKQAYRLIRRILIASIRTLLYLVGGMLELTWRLLGLTATFVLFLFRATFTLMRTLVSLVVEVVRPIVDFMKRKPGDRKKSKRTSTKANERVPLAVRLRPYRSLLMQEQFRQLATEALKGRKIDIVQGHDSHALRASEMVAESAQARLVYDAVEIPTDRSGWAASDIPRWVRRLEDTLNGRVIRRAGGIFTVSHGLAEWMRDNYRIAAPPLVRNCRLYEDFPKDERIRWDCRLGPDDRLALYLNTLYGGQGLEQLIDSIAFLPEHIHIATLGPMPQKPYVAALRQRAESLGVADRFHLLEPKSPADMLAYASGADIGVIPRQRTSLNNEISLPNRVFEMVMARLPIAAPSLPDMRRFVEEYEIGLWFKERQPRDIARVIEAMLEPETLRGLQERVEAAAQQLSWEHEGEHYVKLVESSKPLVPSGRWSRVWLAGAVARSFVSR